MVVGNVVDHNYRGLVKAGVCTLSVCLLVPLAVTATPIRTHTLIDTRLFLQLGYGSTLCFATTVWTFKALCNFDGALHNWNVWTNMATQTLSSLNSLKSVCHVKHFFLNVFIHNVIVSATSLFEVGHIVMLGPRGRCWSEWFIKADFPKP